jgi:hypothetical protein
MDVVVTVSPGTLFGAGVYQLLRFSDSLMNTGDLNSWTVHGPAGFSYQLTDPAGMINLNVIAVPEPTALALLLMGACALPLCRRRRVMVPVVMSCNSE